MTQYAEHNVDSEQHDCCQSAPRETQHISPRPGRFDRLSAPAAVGSAILSSACCWLPLLLLAFGLSAGGVAGFFETVRPYFLVAAVVFLGAGFYFAYIRKPSCKPGEACALPNPKLQRFNRVMLWVAAVFVLTFALFPYYSPTLVRAVAGQPTAASTESVGPTSDAAATSIRTFHVAGMTCRACAATREARLTGLPAVSAAHVSYGEGAATIHSAPGQPSDAQIRAAIEQVGFQMIDPAAD